MLHFQFLIGCEIQHIKMNNILVAREKLRKILGVPYPENIYNMGISFTANDDPCLTVTLKESASMPHIPNSIDGIDIIFKILPSDLEIEDL